MDIKLLFCNVALLVVCGQLKEDEPRLISHPYSNITLELGARSRMGALINKNTFKGGAYSKGGAYWKKGAKSNHSVITVLEAILTGR